MGYFYIIQSLKKSDYFYQGSTENMKRRLTEHNEGRVQSTRPYHPYKLVYCEVYVNEKAARLREQSVKKSGSICTPLLKRIKASLL